MKEKKRKIIGIDARFYGPTSKGLGRYTKEVIDRIIEQDDQDDYVVFLNDENYNDFTIEKSNVRKLKINLPWYGIIEQIFMPYYIWREKIDLMHIPHFNVPFFMPSKYIVTIHDLILTKFPSQRASTLSPLLYKLKNIAYKIIISNAIKKSQKIIAVSEFTKKDIVDQFKANPEKIIVTHEGISKNIVNDYSLVDDQKIILKYGINKNYLLYVGNAYPHKNLEKLLEVFVELKKQNLNIQLVLVGGEDYFYKRLKELVLNFDKSVQDDIIFTGYVVDKDLASFFRLAKIYVFPSLYEGFGLPPLEAMVQGCPVLSSDQASMKEILENSAMYFNPYDKEDMKIKILELLNNKKLQNDLRKKGFEQVRKYSWDKCAEKTFEIYNTII